MELSKTALYRMMHARMGYLSERQAVLSQNVANADTPGYIPKDLEPLNFKQQMQNKSTVSIATTHANHMQLSMTGKQRYSVSTTQNSFDVQPGGNAVVLEEEMLKMNQTAMDYQTTTSMYRKMNDMVRTALGGNN